MIASRPRATSPQRPIVCYWTTLPSPARLVAASPQQRTNGKRQSGGTRRACPTPRRWPSPSQLGRDAQFCTPIKKKAWRQHQFSVRSLAAAVGTLPRGCAYYIVHWSSNHRGIVEPSMANACRARFSLPLCALLCAFGQVTVTASEPETLAATRPPAACATVPTEELASLQKRKGSLEAEIASQRKVIKAAQQDSMPRMSAQGEDALRKSQESLLEVLFQIGCLPKQEKASTAGTAARSSRYRLLHTPGVVETPALWKLEREPDPNKHFVLKAVATKLQDPKSRTVFLFVTRFPTAVPPPRPANSQGSALLEASPRCPHRRT